MKEFLKNIEPKEIDTIFISVLRGRGINGTKEFAIGNHKISSTIFSVKSGQEYYDLIDEIVCFDDFVSIKYCIYFVDKLSKTRSVYEYKTAVIPYQNIQMILLRDEKQVTKNG